MKYTSYIFTILLSIGICRNYTFASSAGVFENGMYNIEKNNHTFLYNIDHTTNRVFMGTENKKLDLFKVNRVSKIEPRSLTLNKSKLHPVRLSVVAGGMFIGWLGMHIYYSQTWWKDRVHYFKYAEDPWYARNVDKMSHVYTANLIAEGSAALYEWGGMKPMPAIVLGSSIAMAYETYIEINDGLSPIWGFDWGDMAANFVGALYPIAQRYVPFLNNINVKWSFNPNWVLRKVQNQFDLLDDYTSMIFWVSVNPKGLLPGKIAEHYPGFLAFAVGVSLKGASHLGSSLNAYREWYLSFDVDITRLPGNSEFMKKLKKILNFYHLPMPTVRFQPTGVWYGIHF